MKVVDCVSAERYDVSGTKCEKGRAVPKKKKRPDHKSEKRKSYGTSLFPKEALRI